MKTILVLCTGNSCRSQMMQAYLNNFLKDKALVYSAGIEAHGLNTLTIKAMIDDGIDISNHTSNNVSEYKDIVFDYLISVCDKAKELCPHFPAQTKIIHYSFPDPAQAEGSETEVYEEFVKVRDMIKEFCIDFSNSIFRIKI